MGEEGIWITKRTQKSRRSQSRQRQERFIAQNVSEAKWKRCRDPSTARPDVP